MDILSHRLLSPTGFDPDTPLPGAPVDPSTTAAILQHLEYLVDPSLAVNAATNARLRTLWTNPQPSNLHFLSATSEPLYLFVEGAKHAHAITAQQFIDYLDEREPWEQYDYYVCPHHASWCWCLTHDDMMLLFPRP